MGQDSLANGVPTSADSDDDSQRVLDQRHTEDDNNSADDPWIIDPKHDSLERLKKWRQATLTVNATRRFRYTSNLKRLEESKKNQSPAARLRASTHVIRAIEKFKKAASWKQDPPPEGFGVGPNTLVHLLQAREYEHLSRLGGVEGVARDLNTSLEDGIRDSPEELQKRKDAYGDNTYPKKRPKGFLVWLWNPCVCNVKWHLRIVSKL
jgi:Ca2+-transporting ATPase